MNIRLSVSRSFVAALLDFLCVEQTEEALDRRYQWCLRLLVEVSVKLELLKQQTARRRVEIAQLDRIPASPENAGWLLNARTKAAAELNRLQPLIEQTQADLVVAEEKLNACRDALEEFFRKKTETYYQDLHRRVHLNNPT